MTSPNGLVTLRSAFGAEVTLDRLLSAVRRHRLQVFATIDHARAACAVGMALRPTTVVIFGSPKAGTPLMAAAPTLAIDLPLRALVWEDSAGEAWVTYNDPDWLGVRHGLEQRHAPTLDGLVDAMRRGLAEIARDATEAVAS